MSMVLNLNITKNLKICISFLSNCWKENGLMPLQGGFSSIQKKSSHSGLKMPLKNFVFQFYVSPRGGDESLAMGLFYKHLGYSDTPPLTHMYMGPEYDSKQIRDALHPF